MPENGSNAIVPMASFIAELNRLNEELKERGKGLGFGVNPSINVGTVRGGVDVLLVPDYCEMNFDRQVFPGESMEEAIREIEDIFSGCCAATRARGELSCNQFFNWWKADPEGPAVRCHEAVTGKKPEELLFRAYAEVEMLERQGIPGVLYGPGNILQAHRPDEYVRLDEFFIALKTYALIGLEFIR